MDGEYQPLLFSDFNFKWHDLNIMLSSGVINLFWKEAICNIN